MDTSVSDDNWGTQHYRIFHSVNFDYRHIFWTVLDSYCCVTVMDTSLSDIIEVCRTL